MCLGKAGCHLTLGLLPSLIYRLVVTLLLSQGYPFLFPSPLPSSPPTSVLSHPVSPLILVYHLNQQ